MVAYSTPPEALDDRFIQILIEELGPKSPSPKSAETDRAASPVAAPASIPINYQPVMPEPDDEPLVELPPESPVDPAVAPGRWVLRVIEEDGPEQTAKLFDQAITIGRSRENTVVVSCSNVSRRHLRVWTEGPAVWIEETTEHRRMYVNGIKMPRSRLQPSDEVRVGSIRIYLEPEASGSLS